jgi:phage gp46-like protein
MDFALTDNLDLMVEDNEIGIQVDGETTLIQAFFTDARVKEQRGYWLDIQMSDVWQYDQKRLTQETANNLNETAKEIADALVLEKLYTRIETSTSINDGVLTLNIKAYDNKNLVVNRKFAI